LPRNGQFPTLAAPRSRGDDRPRTNWKRPERGSDARSAGRCWLHFNSVPSLRAHRHDHCRAGNRWNNLGKPLPLSRLRSIMANSTGTRRSRLSSRSSPTRSRSASREC
jgi:hypothetical protein